MKMRCYEQFHRGGIDLVRDVATTLRDCANNPNEGSLVRVVSGVGEVFSYALAPVNYVIGGFAGILNGGLEKWE